MSFNSIGDLASSLLLRQAGNNAKQSLMTLSTELTTGITSNIRGALRNDLTQQMDWEHRLSAHSVQDKTLSEALVRIQAKQSVLDSINAQMISFFNSVDTTVIEGAGTVPGVLSQSAETLFDQVLSQLNTRSMGQSLFAGADTDSSALGSKKNILTSVKASIGSISTIGDLVQGVNAWMNDPVSGYETVAYLGSNDDISPIRLSENRTISERSTANNETLKNIVENLILGTLASDDSFSFTKVEQTELLKMSAGGLRAADTSMIEFRASLGFVESEIVKQKVQAGAEVSALEQFRSNTLGIDEYEVASKIQETELQLEKIYTLTARSARMSLLEYLR